MLSDVFEFILDDNIDLCKKLFVSYESFAVLAIILDQECFN